jgi:hypothetical protein
MSKAQRVGRIYIDYLRNQRGATSVCAYSTRAREDAPVSVPLHWDELDGTRPDFTVGNVLARLQKLRQDPWKGYEAVKQRILPSSACGYALRAQPSSLSESQLRGLRGSELAGNHDERVQWRKSSYASSLLYRTRVPRRSTIAG